MDHGQEIRDFLVSRRARLAPEDVGLVSGDADRRVPGLRREEVAGLAGISIDYYIRLERGRVGGVSDAVLHAVARALLLDDAEHQHLLDLATAATQVQVRAPRTSRHVRPSLLRLLDAMPGVPAMVQSGRTDVLAVNPLANALYVGLGSGPVSSRNIARFVYLDDRSPDFYADWLQSARDCVAMLRLAAGRTPGDRALNELVGELSVRSEQFRKLWADHDVRDHRTGIKTLHHPVVGQLTLTYESLQVGGSEQTLLTYTAEPGSPSADALAVLASWSATTARDASQPAPSSIVE